MTVLSWTGLVINGLVAFILPMVLAYRWFDGINKKLQQKTLSQTSLTGVPSYDALSSVNQVNIQNVTETDELKKKVTIELTTVNPSNRRNGHLPIDDRGGGGSDDERHALHSDNNNNNCKDEANNKHSNGSNDKEAEEVEEEEVEEMVNSVQAIPLWLEPFRQVIILTIICFFTSIICFTIFMDVWTGTGP